MEAIGQYLVRLTAAALLCAIVTAFFGAKGSFGAVIKLLAGIFLTLNIVSPWVQIRISDISDWADSFSAAADAVGAQGQNAAREAMVDSIIEKTSAYILDKARSLDADLTVEVFLSDADIPVPCRVHISGNISPYGKKMLISMIENELGIPQEEQIWT